MILNHSVDSDGDYLISYTLCSHGGFLSDSFYMLVAQTGESHEKHVKMLNNAVATVLYRHDNCDSCIRDTLIYFKRLALNFHVSPAEVTLEQVDYVKTVNELNSTSFNLPGAGEVVDYPCEKVYAACLPFKNTVRDIIMHLNDVHKWTRDEIADWLESIDDPENGLDLAFSAPGEKETEDESR